MCEHHGCRCHQGRHHHGHHSGGRHGRPHGHGRCCCGGSPGRGEGIPFQRRFTSREERMSGLESYLEELQAEAKAVEERLAAMKTRE